MIRSRFVVAVLGNCIDNGAGLRPGEGYLPIVQNTLQRSMPDIELDIVFEPLAHPKYFAQAVSRVLAHGPDIVLIGAASHTVRSTVKINRLWGLDGPMLSAANQFVAGVERRLAADGRLARGFINARALLEPLRERIPALTTDQYRTLLESAVDTLLGARCRVVFRGPVEVLPDDLTEIQNVTLKLATARNLRCVVVQDSIPTQTNFQLAPGSIRMSQAGHERLAPSIASALADTLNEVIAARLAGEVGVLARAMPPIDLGDS